MRVVDRQSAGAAFFASIIDEVTWAREVGERIRSGAKIDSRLDFGGCAV
jgi:hypothetical protein